MATLDRLKGARTSKAIKAPVEAATTANITLSGEQTIDGVALVADDRVLVKNQTDATENGIYLVANGAWSRTADFNKDVDIAEGTQVLVNEGTTNANTVFVLDTASPTIGTDNLSFTALAAGLSAFGTTWGNLASADAGLTTLGFSTFFKTLIGAASAAALNVLLGLYKSAVTTGSMLIPTGTTAQRVNPAAGETALRYNTTTGEPEYRHGTGGSWETLGGADFSAVAADILPDADSTRDLGSATLAWALAHVDEVRSGIISGADGVAPAALTAQWAARHFVNYDHSTPSVRKSGNTTGVTDVSAGIYLVTIANAMSDANYALAGASGKVGASIDRCDQVIEADTTPTASAYEMANVLSGSGARQDAEYTATYAIGDLA